MKSGLEGRNNIVLDEKQLWKFRVSMKSGLEGRNNWTQNDGRDGAGSSLNEVRPRRPEQSGHGLIRPAGKDVVSMKSGLEGRNNRGEEKYLLSFMQCLNEVRPRRPEQWPHTFFLGSLS